MDVLEYIEYKGERLPFRVAVSTFFKFKMKTGIDAENLGDHYEYMPTFLHIALQEGHKKLGMSFKYSEDDVFEMFNENMDGIFQSLNGALTSLEKTEKIEKNTGTKAGSGDKDPGEKKIV